MPIFTNYALIDSYFLHTIAFALGTLLFGVIVFWVISFALKMK